ncbi:hypothetical protein ETQ85_04070 [Zoogloea oleivorans]|uniref:Cyclic nucleotide-binding domain-containing protein n=1 Tax=Zoogloea oleivorans TaxID=1552750 RepID=A0A6C2D5V8_9RHOO|nr:hypothetical protein [Zoogloea oleivorans]TYC61244.1 hypothetical protein ETQ85_04070 [Zoogloea oleivorans]
MKVPAAIFALLLMAFNASASEEGKSWLSAPAGMNEESGTPIPTEDSCEVPASKLTNALSQLAEKTLIALDPTTVKSLVGECIKIAANKTPYLVRAVYGHRGTGHYFVRRVGDDLLVAHGSLGRYTTYSKSALVVNLSFAPKSEFIMVVIDQ